MGVCQGEQVHTCILFEEGRLMGASSVRAGKAALHDPGWGMCV